MKTTKTETAPTKGESTKRLIFTASTKGGILKTSDTLDLIDHIRYTSAKLRVYDGDRDNKASISRYFKAAEPVHVTSVDQLHQMLRQISSSDDDITIVDLPGAVTDVIGPFLQEAADWFPQLGIHQHVLLHLTADRDTAAGAAAWVATLKRAASYTIFLSPRDGDAVDPQKLPGGPELVEFAQNRVITIPRVALDLVALYRQKRMLKTDLVKPESGLELIDRLRWTPHVRQIWRQISPHFQAITGFPPPPTPEWIRESLTTQHEDDLNPILQNLANQ